MTNPFYGVTGNPTTLSRGNSSTIRAEFQLIQNAFDLVAGRTGQAYTGTQDFTGATVLVPTLSYGASGNFAVSIDYLNNAVFAATLPGQTGNAGKFLMTNGVTASWGATLGIALNESKGTAPASSATPDIWSATGNYVPITSATTITGFPNAPQAGARRRLQIGVPVSMTANANLIIHGGSVNLLVGDEVEVIADSVSTFRATVSRNDGSARTQASFARTDVLLVSGSFTAKISGIHRITLLGAGGGGAAINGTMPASTTGLAFGGSAGGFSQKVVYLNAGDVVNYVAASGGAGVVSTAAAASGGSGGVATLTNANFTMTVNGGVGGGSGYNSVGTGAVAGPSGGTATGGDINFTGGGVGSITATTTAGGTSAMATGGGAPSLKGTIFNSGSVSSTVATNMQASGGAGVGGASGNVTASGNSSGGGGSNGASPNRSSVGASNNGAGAPTGVFSMPINATADGSGTSAVGRVGGGTPGVTGSTASAVNASFAGGGAAVGASSAIAGSADYGGGGGGAVTTNGTVGAAIGGTGGASLAIFEY